MNNKPKKPKNAKEPSRQTFLSSFFFSFFSFESGKKTNKIPRPSPPLPSSRIRVVKKKGKKRVWTKDENERKGNEVEAKKQTSFPRFHFFFLSQKNVLVFVARIAALAARRRRVVPQSALSPVSPGSSPEELP